MWFVCRVWIRPRVCAFEHQTPSPSSPWLVLSHPPSCPTPNMLCLHQTWTGDLVHDNVKYKWWQWICQCNPESSLKSQSLWEFIRVKTFRSCSLANVQPKLSLRCLTYDIVSVQWNENDDERKSFVFWWKLNDEIERDYWKFIAAFNLKMEYSALLA